MAEKKTLISFREYLEKNKIFVIPEYQRGYVWGKRRDNEEDSVTHLMKALVSGFLDTGCREIFLQGVTVTESANEIAIIDGQQRTTFLYLLMKSLGYDGAFRLRYMSGREKSQQFIDSVDVGGVDVEDEKEPFQDIYFFKKTIRTVKELIGSLDKAAFVGYLLDNVKFLYVDIPESQASRVFTMMNGNKAVMLPEEVIKAEILRLASKKDSLPEANGFNAEWDANLLRSRYAREWDKWLYWWNREDVQKMFGCTNTMGLLISSVADVGDGERLTFDLFRRKMLPGRSEKEAKLTFDRLRRRQKLFEDLFNDFETHNKIGAIIAVLKKRRHGEEVKAFVRDFLANEIFSLKTLDDYYRCAFLNMTHQETMRLLGMSRLEMSSSDDDTARKVFAKKYTAALEALKDPLLYRIYPEEAFRYLLRMNVDLDTAQGRVFDFGIWDKEMRSIEHIYPKSQVWHWQDDRKEVMLEGADDKPIDREKVLAKDSGYLDREKICHELEDGSVYRTTEHGIGNLVLLYKDENSSFNKSPFKRKKVLFFNPTKQELTKSRRLLHTVCVFAEQEAWDGPAIAWNAWRSIKSFEEYYEDLCGRYHV